MKHAIREIFYSGLKSYSRAAVTFLALTIVLLIGFIDYETGPQVRFFVIYLMPLCVVAWLGGHWPALITALFAATNLVVAEMPHRPAPSPILLFWNVLGSFASFLLVGSLVAEVAKLRRYQRHLAVTDYLTGLLNLRGFQEQAQREMERADRYGRTFTLVYMDIDGFRYINEDLGHEGGDVVLGAIGQAILKTVRVNDIAARLRSDEFAVLLVETDKDTGQLVASKLQQTLTQMARDRNWPVSFSVGLLTCLTTPESVTDMLTNVRRLLNAAKVAGPGTVKHEVFAQTASIP